MNITLREPKIIDIKFLYDLYKSRDSRENSKPVEFSEQVEFVMQYIKEPENHCYSSWNIIELDGKPIGVLTLKKSNNEVGYWLLSSYQNKGIGSNTLKIFLEKNPRPYFLAVIKHYNLRSKKFIKKFNFKSMTNDKVNEFFVLVKNSSSIVREN